MSGTNSIKELQKRLFENNSTYVVPKDVSNKLFGASIKIKQQKIKELNLSKEKRVEEISHSPVSPTSFKSTGLRNKLSNSPIKDKEESSISQVSISSVFMT